jgi:cell division protein FtsZ
MPQRNNTPPPSAGNRTTSLAPLRASEPVKSPEPVRAPEPVRSVIQEPIRPAAAQIHTAPPPTFSAADSYTQRHEATEQPPRIIEPASLRREEPAPQLTQTAARIVDPLAAEDGDEMFIVRQTLPPKLQADTVKGRTYTKPGQPPLPDPRAPEPKKSGWLSLFGGRHRYEEPPPPPAPTRAPQTSSSGGAAHATKPAPSADPSAPADDLEIPSFLRRLAN